MSNLENYGTDEIKDELRRRMIVHQESAREKRREYNSEVLKVAPELLDLIPHALRSCKANNNAGFNPETGTPRCVKCLLQDWLFDEHIPDDVEITVDVKAAGTTTPDR